MTVVWVVMAAALLLGLLALVGRRTLMPADDDHPWSIDVRRGEVRIPRER
jgi:hypothetical protein